MNTRRGLVSWLLVGVYALLSACGGGSVASGGTGGTGMVAVVSRGPVEATTTSGKLLQAVTAAPTVTVNGVAYDISNATLTGTTSVLPGMIVTVNGEVDANGNATATTVSYSRSLLGAVSGFTSGGNTFSIYGQNVAVDNLTKLEPAGTLLADGQWVEVSGYVLSGGEVRATFIRQLAEGDEVEIEGFIANPASETRTLQVGGATVTVPVNVASDFSQFTAGAYVEVHAQKPAPGGTELIATEISIQDTSLGGDEGDEAEVEGLINAVFGVTAAGPASFMVTGQEVVVTTDTQVSGGLLTDLVPGVKVEVEGSIAGGRLLADEIQFEDSIEVQDSIVSIDSNSVEFTLGVTVALDPVLTEGHAEATLAQPGDVVRIRGRLNGTGVLATQIERVTEGITSDPVAVEIQGGVANIDANAGSFTILETPVQTTPGMDFEVNDQEGVSSATFFAGLVAGDLVSVSGQRLAAPSGTIAWEEAERE